MSAQLGWIDFSEKDRKKALDVIHLLQEQGAVDELGIGIVRDAFANYFFPGTSTVQTRAKYFFIIPYVMKEVCEEKRSDSLDRIARRVDELEHECAKIMGDKDGVIGRDVLPGWVDRKPSSIYWTGLKKLGLFTYPGYTAREYYREELRRKMAKSNERGNRSGEENEQDDEWADASGMRSFWNLPPEFNQNPDWRKTLTIDLLPHEARWMRKCVSENLSGTLFKHIVDNNIDLDKVTGLEDSFRGLTEMIIDDVSEEMRGMMTLANEFGSLVFLCRILYNVMLSEGRNGKALSYWQREQKRIRDVERLDLDVLCTKLKVKNNGLRTFLRDMRSHLVGGDLEAARERILKREIQLKGMKRAKLLRKADFGDNAWIGGFTLDYRLGSAARLIRDIYMAEKEAEDVQK